MAATTGPTNLLATALCNDPAHLHHYLTHQLGSISAIQSVSSAPVLKVLKGAGRAAPEVLPIRPARQHPPSGALSASSGRSVARRPGRAV
ncbi:hypothetical protein [Nocardia nepalensis]|uniref:hypothetical protein n=1 Tax=Nocardia nepalensis TaxID=3375448 RepID=UPI003B673326